MLERYDHTKYVMRAPFFDSFRPSDQERRSWYAQKRPFAEYYAGDAVLPINVAPELLDDNCSKRFEDIGNDLGLSIDLRFTIASFAFRDPHTGREKYTPVHLFTSFRHNGMSIAGPWCPSLGHPVMMHETLPNAIKSSFVKESILHLQYGFNAVVLGMPTRKEDSATGEILMDENLGGFAFSHPACKDTTYYFYPGNGNKDALSLLLDKDFYRIITAIEGTRKMNFAEYRELSAKRQPDPNYSRDLADYIHFLFQHTLSQDERTA